MARGSNACYFVARNHLWEQEISPQALLGKGFMYFDGVERRIHKRRPHADSIEFCLIPSDLTTTLRGISIDISDSGMCLYTFTPINTGQNIVINNFLPVPYQKATVRWVKKHTEELYRVGIMFIE